jgi:hypothetical protein
LGDSLVHIYLPWTPSSSEDTVVKRWLEAVALKRLVEILFNVILGKAATHLYQVLGFGHCFNMAILPFPGLK